MSHNNPYDDIPSPEDLAPSDQPPEPEFQSAPMPDASTGEMTSEYTDAFARERYDDLENLYVKRDKPPGDPSLVIKEGLPIEEEDERKDHPVVRILIVLIIVSAITFGLYSIRPGMVDKRGHEVNVPLPAWIYNWFTMPPEQVRLQSMARDKRRFIVTYQILPAVFDATTSYYLLNNAVPRDTWELVNLRLIEEWQAMDGWDVPFELILEGNQVTVRSSGDDTIMYTADDVIMDASGVRVPTQYQDTLIEYEQGTRGI